LLSISPNKKRSEKIINTILKKVEPGTKLNGCTGCAAVHRYSRQVVENIFKKESVKDITSSIRFCSENSFNEKYIYDLFLTKKPAIEVLGNFDGLSFKYKSLKSIVEYLLNKALIQENTTKLELTLWEEKLPNEFRVKYFGANPYDDYDCRSDHSKWSSHSPGYGDYDLYSESRSEGDFDIMSDYEC
jgi:hypothetical protein